MSVDPCLVSKRRKRFRDHFYQVKRSTLAIVSFMEGLNKVQVGAIEILYCSQSTKKKNYGERAYITQLFSDLAHNPNPFL